MLPHLVFTLWVATLVTAGVTNKPALDVSVRNAPGMTSEQTIHGIRRSLAKAAVQRRGEKLSEETSLDKSFNNALLFRYGTEVSTDFEINNNTAGSASIEASVEVFCRTCYIKGNAKVDFIIDSDFNVSSELENAKDTFKIAVDNITDYAGTYIKSVWTNTKEDGLSLDAFDLPSLNLNLTFDIDMTEIPECQLHFGFDDLELYMATQLTMSAGATYALNLYTSLTPLGLRVNDDISLGVTFVVDLLLSAESEISITSGFHLKLDDGVGIDIALFSDQVSDIVFNGGRFEFLPVTVESEGVTLRALLRVAMHTGIELSTPTFRDFSAGGGVEVSVWANFADLTTSVILGTDSGVRRRDDDEEDCLLRVRQEYLFGLGAAAGATVVLLDHTWGPTPSTEIPIWSTELADECLWTAAAATVTDGPAMEPRQEEDDREGFTTTTLTSELILTALECRSVGLMKCPPSLQSVRKEKVTQSTVMVVPSGVEAEWPKMTELVVESVKEFGSSVLGIEATSGSPVSYIAPPPTWGLDEGILDGKVGGVDKKVILGVSIGVGVPVLLAIIAGIILLVRRLRGRAGVVYNPGQSNIEYTVVEIGAKNGNIQQEIRSVR
ncbi:hypothetical protein ACHAQH_005417 [Verticillium albo-atrum]